MNNLLTVSQLTKQIKTTLEEGFGNISVIGEISGFKPHNSGHWYFNLKDNDAIICCTMWKGYNNFVFFTPQNGIKVIINGKISVYAPKGNYQLDVRSMRPAGVGELQAAFEILKQKLAAEGLFNEEFKKPIPAFPQKIGIVTAIDGAALKDMINIAERRYPLVELIIASSKMQGNGAAEEICSCLRQLNKREDIDLIILARGGGSIEDLWAFNEEITARAIFDSVIPVITGVGHEIDFTIADFVSDLRAPTPSAAMEIATPGRDELVAFIDDFSYNSAKKINRLCLDYRGRIHDSLTSYGFRQPLDIIKKCTRQVENLSFRVNQNLDRKVLISGNKLSLLAKSIDSHDVQRILKKGFVLVKQPDINGKIITRSARFNLNEDTILKFYDGEIKLERDLKLNFSDTN